MVDCVRYVGLICCTGAAEQSTLPFMWEGHFFGNWFGLFSGSMLVGGAEWERRYGKFAGTQ